MDIHIRPAKPDDATKVAPLIYSAAPEKFEYWLGVGVKASKRKARTLQVLADAFAANAGVQGYGVFWVAELYGEIIGMSAGYRGSDAPMLKRKLVQWALPYFKLRFPQVAKRGLNLAKLQNPIADDVYYGSGLGTDTQRRGQGLGQKMIALQMQQAKSFSTSPDDKPAIKTFGFDVAVTNKKALSIYHRMGFSTIWKKQFVKPSVGIPDSYRMMMPVASMNIPEINLSKEGIDMTTPRKHDMAIRKARARDAAVVAPLIYSSGPEIYNYWFAASKTSAIKIIEDAFKHDAGILGYGCHWVAETELDGESRVVGVGAFYSGHYLKKTERSLLMWMMKQFHVRSLGVLKRGLAVAKQTHPISRKLLYVANLGVSPDARGNGVGTALLNFHLAQAKESPYISQYGLDVAQTNPHAQRLYERMGMQQIWERTFPDADSGIPDVRRLVMDI